MTEFSLVVGVGYALGAFGSLALVWAICLRREVRAMAMIIANLPCVTEETDGAKDETS